MAKLRHTAEQVDDLLDQLEEYIAAVIEPEYQED